MDFRKLFQSQYFTAADFDGADITLTIKEVKVEAVQNESGTEQKPCIYFEDYDKPLVMNKTNAKAIAAMYGNDCSEWAGEAVTFRESVTSFRGDEVPCVRVQNGKPKTAKTKK